MSPAARTLYAVAASHDARTPEYGVRTVDWQLKALRDAIEQRPRTSAAPPIRMVGFDPHDAQQRPVEAVLAWAAQAGAAVARVRRTEAHTSVTMFVSALSSGRAPVISPGSARLLHALHGRRAAQLHFLEGLLRRHARHRAILIVVDDGRALEDDTTWLVQQLSALLHDAAVTWMYPPVYGVRAEEPGSAGGRRDLSDKVSATQPAILTAKVTHLPQARARDTDPTDPTPHHPRIPPRPRFGWLALTDTELRVVRLVVQGHTNRATAAALFVSVNTISTHLRSVYNKLDVNSRVQLTRVALRHLPDDDRAATFPPRADDQEGPR